MVCLHIGGCAAPRGVDARQLAHLSPCSCTTRVLQVMEAAATAGRTAGIEPTFGVAVNEEVHCSQCSKTTHQTGYMQFFYHTQVGQGFSRLSATPSVISPINAACSPLLIRHLLRHPLCRCRRLLRFK